MATITDLESTTSGATSMSTINDNFDALNTEIALCLHADGSVSPSANLPMNSKKLTGLAAGSTNGDSVRYEQVLLLAGGTMTGDINLGGNDLVYVASILDVNSNELLKFTSVGSAVNEITIKNAANGNNPEIQATGDGTNIDLILTPKGTGDVSITTGNMVLANNTPYQIKNAAGTATNVINKNASDQTTIGANDVRATRHVIIDPVELVNIDPDGSWHDVDVTANTSARAFKVSGTCLITCGATARVLYMRPNGNTDFGTTVRKLYGIASGTMGGGFAVGLDSNQIFEYSSSHADASAIIICIDGYDEYVD